MFLITSEPATQYRTGSGPGSPAPGSPARQPRWGGKGAARLGWWCFLDPLHRRFAQLAEGRLRIRPAKNCRTSNNNFCTGGNNRRNILEVDSTVNLDAHIQTAFIDNPSQT